MSTPWTARRVLRGLSVLALLSVLGLPFAPAGPPRPAGRAHPPAHGTTLPPGAPRGNDRFLIVGLTQDQHRTDTIMVTQWDDAHHQARILGVPRDIEITLPGVGDTKIVHAYSTGGIGRVRAAVVRLLNIPIAHYIVFSLPAMRNLVDLIGGVPLTVEKRMLYRDREQGLFINLHPGPQVLDGAHAEQYLRFRNDPDGDIGRIRRQQRFFRAALAVVHRPAIWIRLPQIVEALRAEVDTDLTNSQILSWVRRADMLTADGVSAYTIEGRSAVLWDDLARMNLDFWVADTEDLRAKVRWLATGVLPPITAP